MFRVDIVPEAREEIRNLFKTDEIQARGINAVIGDLNKNASFDDLTDKNYECEDFNVDGFWSIQNKDLRNVWRIKIFGKKHSKKFPLRYRVIYAPDYQRNTIHVLGLMKRKIDYEKDKKFVAEIIRRYDKLGLVKIPRC